MAAGCDRGVFYPISQAGKYTPGVAWNGLTTVTESPSGAEATKSYADNIAYLTMVSAEEYGATIEAFTFPDEFALCDGTVEPVLVFRLDNSLVSLSASHIEPRLETIQRVWISDTSFI